jgi:hypothetical protein
MATIKILVGQITGGGQPAYLTYHFRISAHFKICCLSCYISRSVSNVVVSRRSKKMGVAASMSSSQFVRPHEELICSMTVGVSLKNGVLVHVPEGQVSFGLVPWHCAMRVMLDNINLMYLMSLWLCVRHC